MIQNIAIIGAGNGGKAAAADLTLQGKRVRLFEFSEYRGNVEEIITTAGRTFEEAFPEIEKNLYREVSDNKFHAWLEDLRRQSHIKIIK